jgi:methylthioribose-1-phosphate isomerase
MALPSGDAIPIEARDAEEVLSVAGTDAGRRRRPAPLPERAVNYAFDITPADSWPVSSPNGIAPRRTRASGDVSERGA